MSEIIIRPYSPAVAVAEKLALRACRMAFRTGVLALEGAKLAFTGLAVFLAVTAVLFCLQ